MKETTNLPAIDAERIMCLVAGIEDAFFLSLPAEIRPGYKVKRLPVFDGEHVKELMQIQPGYQSRVLLEEGVYMGTMTITSDQLPDIEQILDLPLDQFFNQVWVRLYNFFDVGQEPTPLIGAAHSLEPSHARKDVSAAFCFPLRLIKREGRVEYIFLIGFDVQTVLFLNKSTVTYIGGKDDELLEAGIPSMASRDDVRNLIKHRFRWSEVQGKIFSDDLFKDLLLLGIVGDLPKMWKEKE